VSGSGGPPHTTPDPTVRRKSGTLRGVSTPTRSVDVTNGLPMREKFVSTGGNTRRHPLGIGDSVATRVSARMTIHRSGRKRNPAPTSGPVETPPPFVFVPHCLLKAPGSRAMPAAKTTLARGSREICAEDLAGDTTTPHQRIAPATVGRAKSGNKMCGMRVLAIELYKMPDRAVCERDTGLLPVRPREFVRRHGRDQTTDARQDQMNNPGPRMNRRLPMNPSGLSPELTMVAAQQSRAPDLRHCSGSTEPRHRSAALSVTALSPMRARQRSALE
jgi:hypothetical protein